MPHQKKRRAQRRRKENFCHRDVKNCTQYFMHGIKCSYSTNKLKSILQWSGDKIKPTSWQYKVFALLKKLFPLFSSECFLFICLFFCLYVCFFLSFVCFLARKVAFRKIGCGINGEEKVSFRSSSAESNLISFSKWIKEGYAFTANITYFAHVVFIVWFKQLHPFCVLDILAFQIIKFTLSRQQGYLILLRTRIRV